MGDDVSLLVHPFLFMAEETCLCVGRRVAAGSFFFRLGRLLAQFLFLIMLDLCVDLVDRGTIIICIVCVDDIQGIDFVDDGLIGRVGF